MRGIGNELLLLPLPLVVDLDEKGLVLDESQRRWRARGCFCKELGSGDGC